MAKVEITPPCGVAVWSYFNRTNPATGALGPFLAHELVLEAGEKRLGSVLLDVGRTFAPAGLERLRAAVTAPPVPPLGSKWALANAWWAKP